jgi:hypothetical protein
VDLSPAFQVSTLRQVSHSLHTLLIAVLFPPCLYPGAQSLHALVLRPNATFCGLLHPLLFVCVRALAASPSCAATEGRGKVIAEALSLSLPLRLPLPLPPVTATAAWLARFDAWSSLIRAGNEFPSHFSSHCLGPCRARSWGEAKTRSQAGNGAPAPIAQSHRTPDHISGRPLASCSPST